MRRVMPNWVNDNPWAIRVLEPRCLVTVTAMRKKITRQVLLRADGTNVFCRPRAWYLLFYLQHASHG